MPDWMLDIVALIDYYCSRPGITPYFDEILDGGSTGAISTITELELWQGIRVGEEERHEAILALLERVPLDGAMARRAGQLRQQIGLNKLSLPDAAIAEHTPRAPVSAHRPSPSGIRLSHLYQSS